MGVSQTQVPKTIRPGWKGAERSIQSLSSPRPQDLLRVVKSAPLRSPSLPQTRDEKVIVAASDTAVEEYGIPNTTYRIRNTAMDYGIRHFITQRGRNIYRERGIRRWKRQFRNLVS